MEAEAEIAATVGVVGDKAVVAEDEEAEARLKGRRKLRGPFYAFDETIIKINDTRF